MFVRRQLLGVHATNPTPGGSEVVDYAVKIIMLTLTALSTFLVCDDVWGCSVRCDGGGDKGSVSLFDIHVQVPVASKLLDLHIMTLSMT